MLNSLFENNRRWAARVEAERPGFFTRLLQQQAPQHLWIGCADSRVPANEIVGLLPGELFVHRNLANVVVHSDLNCMSVMEFAVDLLRVRNLIVVGHYGCSGVRAAMEDTHVGIADNWLRHVQSVRNRHQAWLETLSDAEHRLDALCELNVLEQASNVCRSTVIQRAWARGQEVAVHGWIYGLRDGLLQDLQMSVAGPTQVDPLFATALCGLKHRRAMLAANGPKRLGPV